MFMFIFTVLLPLLVRLLFMPIKLLLRIVIGSFKVLEKNLKKANRELKKEISDLKDEKDEANKDKKLLEKEKRDIDVETLMLGGQSETIKNDLSEIDIIQDNITDSINDKRIQIAILRTQIALKRTLIILLKILSGLLELTIRIINFLLNLSAWIVSLMFIGMIVVAVIFVSTDALNFGVVTSGTTKPKEEQKEPSTPVTTGDSSKYVEVLESMAKYEMGNQSPGRVAGDLGDGAGKNYGKYSFTQNYTLQPLRDFMKTEYPDLEKQLKGATASAEFDASWQALGQKEPQKFTEAQADFTVKRMVLPQIETLKKATGLDLNDGKRSIGAISIFASMVHQRPAWINEIIIPQVQAMGVENYTDDKFMESTGGYVRDNYNGNYAESIRNRYRNQVEEDKAKKDKVKL